MKGKNPHMGSSFEDFLAEEGILEECEAMALKEILAMQIEEAMKEHHINKVQMARRMRTSRSQLDRLLDPKHTTIKLETMQRAAAILGKRIHLDLVDAPASH